MQQALQQSRGVLVWWSAISVVSVANVVAWGFVARRQGRDELDGPAARRERRLQLVLSALFVAGCAFRSFLPRAEGQRIVVVDTWLSSVIISRAVATVAELALVAQWTVYLGHWTRATRSAWAYALTRLFLPAIAFAEVCSWYTTLTTDFAGSVIEESTWAVSSTVMTLMMIVLWVRRPEFRRFFIATAIVLNTAYIMFMANVDVPMYRARVRADAASGKAFVTVSEGFVDAARRRVVTRRWVDWKDEMPWMSLYFSAGVWLSLALVRAPRLDRRTPT
jgi:hypothetical protein